MSSSREKKKKKKRLGGGGGRKDRARGLGCPVYWNERREITDLNAVEVEHTVWWWRNGFRVKKDYEFL